ncbi:putative dioxygenase [Thermoplasmatales archaeon SCGC AB-539-C06]|nr:putative dioxygenase [Thermoplasmatales archaeon SCGC AB-539-C06]
MPVKNKEPKKIIGAVAPHAGYQFSGSCQAWVYKEIGESELPDVFIILGTNHTRDKKSTTLLQEFETPFGIVKVDQDFTKKLIEEGWIVENEITQIKSIVLKFSCRFYSLFKEII